MGNKDSSPISTFSDWEKVDTFNGIQIYRNKKNNQLAQKRIITVDPQYNMKQQLKVYSMREHNGDGLVRALAVEDIQKQTSSQGLCSSQKKLMVLTEKMPYRLSQLPQLTFPQTLLILRQSLRGYQRIYKDYGPVQVSQQLIGLNYFGEVKCWLNENWALNHRSHEYMNLKAAKVGELTKEQYLAFRGEYLDESEMVRSIVKAVEGKCEEGKFPVAFQEEVQNQAGSFKKLALYLKDFVQYNEIFVPEKLQYDALVKVRYQERLQHQLQIHSGQNTQQQESQMHAQSQDTVANNFIQSIFQLQGTTNNPNLPKQTQQIPSQFPVPQPTKALTPGLSSKQSPSGDTLGHITFTPSNRAYNFSEQSNQFSSGSSKNIITNGSFQATPNWKSNLQTVETTYYNGSNGGIGTVGSSSKIPSLTTPTKPQIPSYQPTYAQFTTSTYEPYQPTFSKYDSFSTVSNNTSIPSSQPASKYSYTYSNSFASSSQFGGLNQSGSINGNGLSGNGLNGNGVSNYSLSYGTLKNSEASYTPNSTAFGYSGNGFGVGQSGNSVYSSTQQNVVQPYSKSSTYEERAYGGKVQQGTLFGTTQTTANATTYEQFKKQFNQGNIIDGRTGQLVSTSQTPNTNPSQLGYTLNTSSPTTAYNFSTSPSFQLPSFTANSGTTAVKTTNQPSYQSASNYSYKSTYTTGQPSTGFSFNGNDALNGKFNVTGYEGKGYTNTLTKYQTTTTKQSSQPSNYMQAFTSLLSPQIQQKMSQANFTSQSNFHEDQPQINVNTVSSKSTTPVASPRPSQTYSQNRVSQGMATSNLTNEQQNKSQNNFLAGLAKMVERASNEVSDSVAKEFSN